MGSNKALITTENDNNRMLTRMSTVCAVCHRKGLIDIKHGGWGPLAIWDKYKDRNDLTWTQKHSRYRRSVVAAIARHLDEAHPGCIPPIGGE